MNRVLISLMWWASASFCIAQNGFTISSTTATPTFECIGVVMEFSGDDNENSSATLEYKKQADSTWLPAHAPVVDHRTTIPAAYQNEVRGSIVGLDTNTAYDVRITITDADGVTGTNPATATATTKTWTVPVTGDTVYVDGDQAMEGDGTSGNPYKTISNAITQLAGGGTILVRDAASDYASLSISTNGTASNYILIKADTGATPQIDGASTNTISGDYIAFDGITFEATDTTTITQSGDHAYYLNCDWPDISNVTSTSAGDGGISIGGAITGLYLQNCTMATDDDGNYTFAVEGNTAGVNQIVIDQCTFTGIFRDIVGATSGDWDNSDLSNCTLSHSPFTNGDDGVEWEGTVMNSRIWGNTITGKVSCLATGASITVGPLYVFRNILDASNATGSCTKLGGNSIAYVYYYHNVMDAVGATTGDALGESAGLAYSENSTYKNNIFIPDRYALYRQGRSNVYDYNLYDLDAATNLADEWEGSTTYADLAAFQAGTTHEDNGVEGSALLSSSYVPASNSPAIDAGLAINNFNGPNTPWPIKKGGADIGAFELGGGLTVSGTITVGP